MLVHLFACFCSKTHACSEHRWSSKEHKELFELLRSICTCLLDTKKYFFLSSNRAKLRVHLNLVNSLKKCHLFLCFNEPPLSTCTGISAQQTSIEALHYLDFFFSWGLLIKIMNVLAFHHNNRVPQTKPKGLCTLS